MGEIKRIPIKANEHMYPSIPSRSALDMPPPIYSFPVPAVSNGYSYVAQLYPHTVAVLCACGSSGGSLWMIWGKCGE